MKRKPWRLHVAHNAATGQCDVWAIRTAREVRELGTLTIDPATGKVDLCPKLGRVDQFTFTMHMATAPAGRVSTEEDGDEVFTPMPKFCQRLFCREHRPRLVKRNGFMVCPRCSVSYGKV
jgi:hypothetical protein